jgi:hypothetical protein
VHRDFQIVFSVRRVQIKQEQFVVQRERKNILFVVQRERKNILFVA